jgi:glucokinase
VTKSRPSAAVGIDLGGTATRLVAWQHNQVVAQTTIATAALGEGSPRQRIRRLSEIVTQVIPQGSRTSAIGIGASGPIDPQTGIIKNPDTLPWFSGFDLAAQLNEITQVPVIMENDAVTAALGEFHQGAGRGTERMLLVTLGTGIGVALLQDAKPLRQPDGRHPEAGHIPVSSSSRTCYCGLTGCWEPTASRQALDNDLRALQQGCTERELIAAGARAARSGDTRAAATFREYGRRVGRGLVLLHSVYGPTLTIIGGSVSTHLDLIRGGIAEATHRAAGFELAVPIIAAQLGQHAGAIGSAILASGTSGEVQTHS